MAAFHRRVFGKQDRRAKDPIAAGKILGAQEVV
jgi:hypothetical protein